VEPSCAKGLTQTFLHGITADVEPHTADLADTLPWMCPNDTGISGEAPKPAGLTDIYFKQQFIEHKTDINTASLIHFDKHHLLASFPHLSTIVLLLCLSLINTHVRTH